ncbi:MAG TPA: GNAT family N-acetyltransferase [Roseiarcus sp.]|nr:GNAT family N-acetyltransferase [Roseiarcus sp.]
MTREPRQPLEFRLRPARPRDYFFAVALYLDGAKRHLSKIGRWDQRRLTVKFRHGYKQVQTQVICVGGKPIGWMQVAEFVGRLHLRQLHLVAGFRRRGIGTRLIKDLLRRADGHGKPVTLDVMHGNPARFLYLRLGFRQTGQDADKRQMIWRPPARARQGPNCEAQKPAVRLAPLPASA